MRHAPNRRLTGTLSLALLVARAVAPAARADEPVYYGGIEIGAKGIEVVALPIDLAEKPDLARAIDKLPHQAVNNVTLADRAPDGSFRPEAIAEARAAVGDFYKHLTETMKIPPERIFIVASSGLTVPQPPPNFAELEKAIREATGGAKSLEKIDQATEVKYIIRGAIPREVWDKAVLIDIGSGNVKCGYHLPRRNLGIVHVEGDPTVSDVIQGTVTYTQTIEREMAQTGRRGFAEFCRAAERLRTREVVEKLAAQIERKPALENRRRVYLSGGAPWAIVTLTDPVAATRPDALTVPVSLADIRRFRDELARTGQIPLPDLTKIADKKVHQEAEEAVQSVLDHFTQRNLLAGAELLLGFAEVLRWQELNKEVYFTRSGVVAGLVGYVQKAR